MPSHKSTRLHSPNDVALDSTPCGAGKPALLTGNNAMFILGLFCKSLSILKPDIIVHLNFFYVRVVSSASLVIVDLILWLISLMVPETFDFAVLQLAVIYVSYSLLFCIALDIGFQTYWIKFLCYYIFRLYVLFVFALTLFRFLHVYHLCWISECRL